MECLHCGKKIGRLRQFLDQEYCSDAHRKAQRKKQNELALDFLLKTKPHYLPEPRAGEAPHPAPTATEIAQPAPIQQPVEVSAPLEIPPPVEVERPEDGPPPANIPARIPVSARVEIPQLAASWAIHMPYAVPGAAKSQLCDAIPLVPERALPQAEATGPRAATSFELLQVFSQTRPAAASMPREIGAVKSTPAGFVCQAVRVDTPGSLAHPLWLGPSKPEPGRKQARIPEPAAFTKIRIGWNCPAPEPSGSRTTAPFEQVVTYSALGLRRAQPMIGLASFLAQGPAHACAAPSRIDNKVAAARQFTSTSHEWACAPVSQRRTIGFQLCPARACILPQSVFPVVEKTARLPEPVAIEPRPRETAPAVILRQPVLTMRSSQPVQPPAADGARARKTGVRAPLPAEFRIRLDTARCRPMRPSEPSASSAAGVPAGRAAEPEHTASVESGIREASPDFRLRAAAHWRRVPGWARRAASAAVLVAACGYGVSIYVQSSAGMRHRQLVQTQIAQRAAIELEDDFREGLSRWTGPPGWAASWSFDGTGTARCGKLALFEPSLALTDYRLEFMGQIEKLAIAWVFRATDRNNYYATKLLETGRGPMPGLSLLRYAVVQSHQRMRVQLPLPVVPAGKSMHRIRQEIRGAQFTTFLDGRLIDTWSDTSLTRGGVGFFSDSGEVAYLRWVTIADQDDTLGRICGWLSPRLR